MLKWLDKIHDDRRFMNRYSWAGMDHVVHCPHGGWGVLMNFDKAFEMLIGHEGSYVNHPRTPGRDQVRHLEAAVPGREHQEMTLVRAKDIYQRDYWWKAGCDLVPDAVKFDLFDTAVNAGPGAAIRMLQRAVGVEPDGVIGPQDHAGHQQHGSRAPGQAVQWASTGPLEQPAHMA